MHTVVETQQFSKRVKALKISDDAATDMINSLAENPNIGDSLGGGLHKARIARKDGGKSGGYRVLYFYKPEDMPIFLLTLFAKKEKDNISQAEKKILIELCEQLTRSYKSKP